MTSRAVTGLFGGIGEGLSIIGRQGLQDNSEKARIQLMNDLQLNRDGIQAQRAETSAENERKWKTAEAEKATAALVETNAAKMEWEREKETNADKRAAAKNDATIKAAQARGSKGGRDYLSPQAKAFTDSLNLEYTGLQSQEMELAKILSEVGEFSPTQKAAWDSLQAQKDDNRKRFNEVLTGQPEPQPISDDTLKSVLSKVAPEDMDEFLAEAKGKYGDDIVTRMRGLATPKADPAKATETPKAAPPKDGGILGTPPKEPLDAEKIIQNKRNAEAAARVAAMKKKDDDLAAKEAARVQRESRAKSNGELSKKYGSGTTPEIIQQWKDSYTNVVKSGAMPPKRTIEKMVLYFDELSDTEKTQVSKYAKEYGIELSK